MGGVFRRPAWHHRHLRRRVTPPHLSDGAPPVDPPGGPPTLTILLDDGTGTFPYDVTGYVRLDLGMTISVGREDEQAAINPSQLSLTFDNSDGLFTLDDPTYDIRVGQGIRVTINGVNRFTGFVNRWPVAWQGGPGVLATSAITASCMLARLSRWEMRSLVEEEMLLPSPSGYWTLGDPAGSTVAAQSNGDPQVGPLIAAGEGTAVVFGDNPAGAEFAAGQYLTTRIGEIEALAFTLTTSTSGQRVLSMNDGARRATVTAAGKLQVAFVGDTLLSTTEVDDGLPHRVVVSDDGVDTRLYIDGTLEDTGASGFNDAGPSTDLDVGVGPFILLELGIVTGFTGVLAHLAVYATALTAAEAEAIAETLDGVMPGVDVIERIATITGSPTGTLATSLTDVEIPDLSGRSAADVLAEVAAAEVGVVYVDGSGDLRFRNRLERPLKLTADWTISTSDSELIGVNTEVDVDVNDVLNHSTGQRVESGAVAQLVTDQGSIDLYGRYSRSATYWVQTDDEARDRASWAMHNAKTPRPKVRQLALDLFTASTSEQEAGLAVDIGTRISLADLPAQAPDIGDLFVEGWTETISLTEWTIAANVTNWANQAAWVLEDATYGVLDNTTKLYV